MGKYVIWNDTHKVIGTQKEFDNVDEAERCITILRNNIRTIIKLNGGRSKFMNPDNIKFVILDKKEFENKFGGFI